MAMASTGKPARRDEFVYRLPKIELHAHLNGSIRRSTLCELAAARGIDAAAAMLDSPTPQTLSEAFDVFRVIHACVTTMQDIERLAVELAYDLDDDGVVYAEIRTTPRALPASLAAQDAGTLDEYVEAVLRGFERYTCEQMGDKVGLRLILSIDRAKHTASDAQAIVDLALRFQTRGVVGMDLSGDPTKGEWANFEPALQRARLHGLKITLHAGEVRGRDDEMAAMLAFHPDRFGHCCFVSAPNLALLKQSGVPIELCLTSNLLSNSTPSLERHHFRDHYTHVDSHAEQEERTVCCISTDDSGVFNSPLSNEFRLVMQTFALDQQQAFHLARRTLQATFLTQPRLDSPSEAMNQLMREDDQLRRNILARFAAFHQTWRWN